MIPTINEKQWLQDYLFKSLRYRETYNEIYDHILTALEHEPATQFFETTVYNVIEKEFGGSSNMLYMEVESKRAISTEIKMQYWRKFTEWFKLPLFAYTLIIIAFNFYFSGSKHFLLGMLSFIIFLSPILIAVVRKILRRFKDQYYKPSIKEGAFDRLLYRYILLNNLALAPLMSMVALVVKNMLHLHDYEIIGNLIYKLIISSGYALIVINNLAVIRVYLPDFKTRKAIS